jgi:predicted CXXCH cytochrome family protein
MSVLVVGLFAASLAFAGSAPGTGIKSTAHDLSSTIYTTAAELAAGDRICIYCHAPHNVVKAADAAALTPSVTYVPLWNHKFSTVTAYTMYTNTSTGDIPNLTSHQLNATLGQPGGVSLLCLSCHDGSVGVNEYGNFYTTNSTGSNPNMSLKGNGTGTRIANSAKIIGGAAAGGTTADLSNHHPIGFNYAAVAAIDDEIADPSTMMNTYYTIDQLLWNGKMECTTCHDVHNTKNEGLKFVWKSDNKSAFCLTCHLKG